MAFLPDTTDHLDFQIAIRLFQRTVRGSYQNMTLDECLKKAEPSTQANVRRLWLRKGPVSWQEGGAGPTKTMLVILAFHRREVFDAGETVADPPHFYLSVGLSDANLKIDSMTGEESDSDLSADCSAAIVLAIKDTCRDFDDNFCQNGEHNRLYIAPHKRLSLPRTRLRRIIVTAENGGYLGPMTSRKKVKGIWPAVNERQIVHY